MKKLTFVFLLLFPLSLISQEFAPVGALWHYTQWTINPEVISFKTIESVSDTSIDGTPCRKLIEVERYIDTIGTTTHFMYSHNDSVFFFADEEFHLLYDFGAITGDTIFLDYFQTFNGSPLKMIIDSTGIVDVSGEQRKIQFISCGDGIVIEFGQHVISGIGNTWFMFPTLDGTINGPLRCYQDNDTPLYLSPFHNSGGWNSEDCEEIITSIEETNSSFELTVFPNPTKDEINIRGLKQKARYILRNNQGKLVKQGYTIPSSRIEVSELPSGIYIIEIVGDGNQFAKKIYKI